MSTEELPTVIIPISGEVDYYNLHRYNSDIKRQLAVDGIGILIADLRQLEGGDAGFYAVSIRLFKAARLKNVVFQLGGPFSESVRGRLADLKIDRLINIVDLNELEARANDA